MIVISVESSHSRGMGHFFRALNMIAYFQSKNENSLLVLNNDINSISILEERKVEYRVVDYKNLQKDWAASIIKEFGVNIWILDMFETEFKIAQDIKDGGVCLVAIDDRGEGARLVDFHFCGMLFGSAFGAKVFSGKDYLLLNKEIDKYRRIRNGIKKVIITLGGSDTYGVTVKVVKILKKWNLMADIVIGPNFNHMTELKKELSGCENVFINVPSLIEKLNDYDLAITGGGVTCFEANAMGLPVIIVANEIHEIELGKYLEGFGGAVFAGFHNDIDESRLNYINLNVNEMSKKALKAINTNGLDKMYKTIKNYT